MIRKIRFLILLVSLLLLMNVSHGYAQWYEIESGVSENLLDGCFVSDSVGFVIGYNGKVLKTIDAGFTWNESIDLPGYFTCISNVGKDTIYVAGSALYRSVNCGNSWSLVADPDFGILDIVFFKANVGFALSPEYDYCTWIYGTNSSANFKIYKTIDYGITWQLHSSNIESNGRFEKINDSCAFIIGGFHAIEYHCAGPWYNASIKTVDAGENWSGIIQPYYGNSLISFVNEDIGFYIQQSQGFYKTTDGGYTITQQIPNVNPASIDHFKFVDEENGYFISKNIIYKTDSSLIDWKIDYLSFDTLNYFFKNNNQFLYCVGKNGKILRKNITPNTPIDTLARIAINPEKLNLGYVQVDSSRIKTVQIINTGTIPLNFNAVTSLPYSMSFNGVNFQVNLNFNLNVFEDTTVYVQFIPPQEIHYLDSMVIDFGNGTFNEILLSGTGYHGFSGNILSDTIICVDTLRISGNVTIKPEAKLTICGGTYVNFMDDSQILVEGQLEAIGDSLNTIDFAVNDPVSICGGLIISNLTPNTMSAKLDYCNFNAKFYSSHIDVKSGTVSVNHSNFSKSDYFAIYANNQFGQSIIKLSISNSTIFKNQSYGVYCGGCDTLSVLNCIIYENYSGIRFFSTHSEVAIIGNRIFNNLGLGIEGLGNCKIQNNKLYNNGGGINLEQSLCKILNNEVYNNKSGTVGGISLNYGLPESYIYQNIIYNNENSQLQTGPNSYIDCNGAGINLTGFKWNSNSYISPIYICNNIVCNNKTSGLGNNLYSNLYHSKSKLVISNNIFYDILGEYNSASWNSNLFNVFSNNCLNSRLTIVVDASNIFKDPMFVKPTDTIGRMTNIENSDWSLKASSFCINNGDLINIYPNIPYDFVGNPRVFENKVDIGAFEYQGFLKPATDAQLIVFPNPTSDYIMVSVNSNLSSVFTLYDTSLKLFLKVSFISITKIDLSEFAKGIYIYNCRFSDGTSINGKLVKF